MEPESPRTGKSLDSLLEPWGGLGSKKPPASSLNLAGAGARSLPGDSATPQNVHAASSCLPEKAAPGREPQETGGESSPTSQEMTEPDAPFLLLEPMELPPDFKRCRTPGKEPPPQGEWREPRRVGDVSSSPLAAAAEEEISRGAEEKSEGIPAQPLGDDCFLEGPPAPESSDPHHLESADGSAPGPGTELGLHKCHSLPLPLGLSPVSGSTRPGNVSVGRPKDQEEEAGISLASALKELHRLLVVSSKHDFRRGGGPRQEESHRTLGAPPEGSAAAEDAASSSREQARQDPALSRPAACLEAGTEMPEESRLAGGEQEAARGASSCGDSVPASPLWSLPQAEESLSIPARLSSSGHHPSCTAAGQSSLASLSSPESSWAAGGSPSLEEGGDSSEHPDEEQPEPRSPPALTANLDQIVGAGFTPQEAGEALEHAGGDADLALLILLARNIVVPT